VTIECVGGISRVEVEARLSMVVVGIKMCEGAELDDGGKTIKEEASGVI
jgi:hypothetical protein